MFKVKLVTVVRVKIECVEGGENFDTENYGWILILE